MKRLFYRVWLVLVLAIAIGWGIGGRAEAIAAIAPSQQTPTEIRVHLSNEANELVFVPNQLTFQVGKRYKLILDNPSSLKHYFTAKDFAGVIWTQKVEAGNVEIKGAISELELRPGTTAEWVFIPMKPGTYKLRCPIPGHTEAGMVGELTIAS
ncbi:MAG TPA: plastocyanin/azurin family copper-binding protein [Coleofasciculaceae cyanobacterium]